MVLIMNIYIYVDDIREDDTFFKRLSTYTNMEWIPIICRTAIEATSFLEYYNGRANIIIDLDHDLGEGNEMDNTQAPNGYDICKKIVEWDIPLVGFHIHSMNPVGAANMRQLLTHYGYKEIQYEKSLGKLYSL